MIPQRPVQGGIGLLSRFCQSFTYTIRKGSFRVLYGRNGLRRLDRFSNFVVVQPLLRFGRIKCCMQRRKVRATSCRTPAPALYSYLCMHTGCIHIYIYMYICDMYTDIQTCVHACMHTSITIPPSPHRIHLSMYPCIHVPVPAYAIPSTA